MKKKQEKSIDALIGLNFKIMRKDLKISQQQIAKKMGMHQAAISRIENGTQCLTLPQAVLFLAEIKFNPAENYLPNFFIEESNKRIFVYKNGRPVGLRHE